MSEGVREKLEELKPQLPTGIRVEKIYDKADSIEESVTDVKFTMLLTLFLVIMVIFLFLRNVRATVIPSLALPFSLIGTCCVMWALDYSLDNLSLMALTLAVGFVVDDAIVMLENVVRTPRNGQKAHAGRPRRIERNQLHDSFHDPVAGRPCLSRCSSCRASWDACSASLPSPIGVAILVSGFISLTLTPMLCARFLKGEDAHVPDEGKWRSVERMYQASERSYVNTLGWVMRHRGLTMLFSAAMLALTVVLFMIIPKGFIPSEDTGRLSGSVEGPEGVGYEALVAKMRTVAEIVRQDTNVAFVLASVGGGFGGNNSGRLQMTLKPRGQRPHVDEIMRTLTRKTASVPGVQVFFRNPPPINIGGRRGNSSYQISLQGSDIAQLYTAGRQLEQRLRDLPEIEGISSDLQVGNPQVGR